MTETEALMFKIARQLASQYRWLYVVDYDDMRCAALERMCEAASKYRAGPGEIPPQSFLWQAGKRGLLDFVRSWTKFRRTTRRGEQWAVVSLHGIVEQAEKRLRPYPVELMTYEASADRQVLWRFLEAYATPREIEILFAVPGNDNEVAKGMRVKHDSVWWLRNRVLHRLRKVYGGITDETVGQDVRDRRIADALARCAKLTRTQRRRTREHQLRTSAAG